MARLPEHQPTGDLQLQGCNHPGSLRAGAHNSSNDDGRGTATTPPDTALPRQTVMSFWLSFLGLNIMVLITSLDATALSTSLAVCS